MSTGLFVNRSGEQQGTVEHQLLWLHSKVMHTKWDAVHWVQRCAAGSVSEAFVSYDRCARLYLEAASPELVRTACARFEFL